MIDGQVGQVPDVPVRMGLPLPLLSLSDTSCMLQQHLSHPHLLIITKMNGGPTNQLKNQPSYLAFFPSSLALVWL